jgi:RNA ligase (TIGR02306 family)
MSERKLSTVRVIDEITPIPDADSIETARIGGWEVVVKKDEFKVGDMVVYFETDSWIPNKLAPFLSKGKEPRQYMGVKGEKLRTVRLRKQLSQGLILPLNCLASSGIPFVDKIAHKVFALATRSNLFCKYLLSTDFSKHLNVNKWELQLPAALGGIAKGNFPSFLCRTDQERCQNLSKELTQNAMQEFEVSIKLDGSSLTVFVKDGVPGVCSRNLELKESDDNSFWKCAKQNQLIEAIQSTGRNLALQSEMLGTGIQGNQEKVIGLDSYVFDIFDIDMGKYLPPPERTALINQMNDSGFDKVKQVPILGVFALNHTIKELLVHAEGPSMNSPQREGLVWKRLDGQFSFKAISNKWLLKNDV